MKNIIKKLKDIKIFKMNLNARLNFNHIKWFDNIVIAANLKPFGNMVSVTQSSNKNNDGFRDDEMNIEENNDVAIYQIVDNKYSNSLLNKTFILDNYFEISYPEYWEIELKLLDKGMDYCIDNKVRFLTLKKHDEKYNNNEAPQITEDSAKITLFIYNKNKESIKNIVEEYFKPRYDDSELKIIKKENIKINGINSIRIYFRTDWGPYLDLFIDYDDDLYVHIGAIYGEGSKMDKLITDIIAIQDSFKKL